MDHSSGPETSFTILLSLSEIYVCREGLNKSLFIKTESGVMKCLEHFLTKTVGISDSDELWITKEL